MLAPLLLLATEIELVGGESISLPGNLRSPVRRDAVEYELVSGKSAGLEWKSGGNSRLNVGSYGRVKFESDARQIMFLESTGNAVLYANGVPRAGDVYGYGYMSVPVLMNKGTNELIFSGGRGEVKARLVEPKKPISWDTRDTTLPDVIEGERETLWAGIVLRNASEQWFKGGQYRVLDEGGKLLVKGKLKTILPLTIRKQPIQLGKSLSLTRKLQVWDGVSWADEVTLTLRKRKPTETHRMTFVSGIDGSVQYYAVNPSSLSAPGQSLILSLHGASVEAQGQAEAYGQKDWANLIAPTNRRPFGFDWEEVGRRDALEVLDLAKRRFRPDPSKVILTGHSMGGHGTWQIGAHFPSLFAGIGPCAAWESFFTYGGGQKFNESTPIETILKRAMNPSDTLLLKQNYAQESVYVLHGDADATVPVAEARRMRAALEPFHRDLNWHEEPGQGHWYDTDPAPGANCVDYAPMFDILKSRQIPKDPDSVDFTTISPGISATCHWLTIEQQIRPYDPSRIQATPGSIKTTNVDALRFGRAFSGDLDQFPIEAAKGSIWKRFGRRWQQVRDLKGQKSSARPSGFKEVINRNLLLVIGTGGTAAENTQLLNHARFDAEQFGYRGNGSLDAVTDVEFLRGNFKGRNLFLYGNTQTNRAYSKVVTQTGLEVNPGTIRIGSKAIFGNDLACVFVAPRKDDALGMVGVIAGTGLVGARLTERTPIYTPGAGFPDYFVWSTNMLLKGTEGVRVAGFFDNQWKVGEDMAIQ